MTTQNSNKQAQSREVKLSYSSMKLLQSCEQRYHHYKVSNTPKDEDYKESDSLGLGSAFHKVLEDTLHTRWDEKLLLEAMTENNVDPSDADLLRVMLTKYIEFRQLSGLKIIRCEFGIETSMYVGYIDAIAIEPKTKKWWLVDLKTASRHDPNLIPQLSKDMQIGLYSHFVPDIENAFSKELDGYEFGGFKYCQTIKSKATTQKGLESGVKVYEMTVPADMIDADASWSLFSEVHDRALELTNGEAPKKNYQACFNYYNSCPYFSKCFGYNFTATPSSIRVDTINTINDEDFL